MVAPDMAVLLQAFQVCDSTFPIGTFNHSFGMETYTFEGTIRKAPDFDAWIERYFGSQYRYGAVSYTHLTLPTTKRWCRSRWSPYH